MSARKLAFVCLVLFGVALCSLRVVHFFSMRPPKESVLIERFRADRPAYERLRDMLLEDKNLTRVFVDYGVAIGNSPVVSKPSDVHFQPVATMSMLVCSVRLGAMRYSKGVRMNLSSFALEFGEQAGRDIRDTYGFA